MNGASTAVRWTRGLVDEVIRLDKRAAGRGRIALSIIAALGVLAGLVFFVAGDRQDYAAPRALLQASDWENDGGFSPEPLPVSRIEIDSRMRESPEFYTFRSWWPETGSAVGHLRSRSFELPDYLAISYTGFPGEAAETFLRVVCETDRSFHTVANARTNTQWSTVYLKGTELCSGPARIEASNSESLTYVGISTPFEVSAFDYMLHTSVAPRAAVVIITWMIFVSIGLLAIAASRTSSLLGLATAFCVAGGVAMLVLATFMFATDYGRVLAFVAGVAAILAAGSAAVLSAGFRRLVGESLPLVLLWLGYSIGCVSLVSIFDNGAGSWTVNALFTPLRWSSDNQLPMLLAEALWHGDTPQTIQWGPWLASDRTPLLSAGMLLVRGVVGWSLLWLPRSIIPIIDEAIGITLLCSWVLLVPFFARSIELRFSVASVVVAATTPFILFNSLYIWPKLLGASYLVLAFVLLASIAPRPRPIVLVLVACCAAFAYLSHASNAFGLVPLAIYFLPSLLRFGPARIATATLIALLVASPWLYWTFVLQPGGNALLRSALAGTFGFDIRDVPLLHSVAEAYAGLSPEDWLAQKASELMRLIGLGPKWTTYGEIAISPRLPTVFGPLRVLDFYEAWRSMLFPLLAILGTLVVGGGVRRTIAAPVAIGVGGLLFTVVVTLLPSYVHHMPYGSILLIALAGSAAVSAMPVWAHGTFAGAAVAYAGTVWIMPLHMSAARVAWPNCGGIILAGAILLAAHIAWRRALANALPGG